MNALRISQFGNQVLRQQTIELSKSEILSRKTQMLIKDMQKTLISKKLGIGLAATQVGESVRLAVIEIQKTASRKDVEEFSLVIINPKIIKVFGNKSQMWEGCISAGVGKANLFAKVPRYKKIELEYTDEKAKKQTAVFDGLPAHVIQHEVDHLNGILFVDKVKDTTTYMSYSEYKKMKQRNAQSK